MPTMNREELREDVWLKYNKHCAYCGREIEYKDMQVDHQRPLAYAPFPDDKNSSVNSFENLMPSCRRCNHYKRANNLEQYRRLIKTLHKRIQSQYISKVAIDYGIVKIKPFNGIFYFEKKEELREFIKENDIKLLRLLEYLRKRNYKKIEKETVPKCQK